MLILRYDYDTYEIPEIFFRWKMDVKKIEIGPLDDTIIASCIPMKVLLMLIDLSPFPNISPFVPFNSFYLFSTFSVLN